jgi:methionine synthase I (cobalamin-dependent)
MGTRLIARGLDLSVDDPGLWNLTHPADVLDIHRRDVSAGADVLIANTFGLNLPWLKRSGYQEEFRNVNRCALELACGAAGPDRLVIAGIGPAAALEPGAIADQAAVLIEYGVSGLLLETFHPDQVESALVELQFAVAAGVPIVASLWQWPEAPGPLARRLLELGASALGMNCQLGAEAAVRFVNQLAGVVTCPLLVKPSGGVAGDPDCTPEAFARAVPVLIRLGARLIGGCCGTTEEHVAAIAGACRYRGARRH